MVTLVGVALHVTGRYGLSHGRTPRVGWRLCVRVWELGAGCDRLNHVKKDAVVGRDDREVSQRARREALGS